MPEPIQTDEPQPEKKPVVFSTVRSVEVCSVGGIACNPPIVLKGEGKAHSAPYGRPDLRKESLAFETVRGVGRGAVIGAFIEGGIALYSKLTKRPVNSIGTIAGVVGMWGAFGGIINWIASMARNDQKAAVRPYVQRLEAEVAAKNALPDNHQRR